MSFVVEVGLENCQSNMKVIILDLTNTCTCDCCFLYQLDIEFGRLFDGKAEMFIRRWESSIIAKLKQIAILEKGVVSSLLDQTGNQNDGK